MTDTPETSSADQPMDPLDIPVESEVIPGLWVTPRDRARVAKTAVGLKTPMADAAPEVWPLPSDQPTSDEEPVMPPRVPRWVANLPQ